MVKPVWIETVLEAALLESEELSSLIADRVYPLKIPQGTVLPYVLFQRLSSNPRLTLMGYSSESAIIKVSSFGNTYAMAKAVALAVRGAIASTPLQAILRTDQDVYDDSSATFCVTAEYLCNQYGGFYL